MTTELTMPELPIGVDVVLRHEWEPVAAGLGNFRLFVDDEPVASAHEVPTAPSGYSMVQEGLSIGRSWEPPVDHGHDDGSFEFAGSLDVVELRTDPGRRIRPADRG